MDVLTLSRKDTGEEQISAPAMNQCNKSLIQNWFKSQKTFSFVSGGAQQKRLNMEMSEQQQQTELSKQRSQLSFFQSDAAFSQFFSLRWSVEVKWSWQSRHNEIWRSAACWDGKWGGTNVPRTWDQEVILNGVMSARTVTRIPSLKSNSEKWKKRIHIPLRWGIFGITFEYYSRLGLVHRHGI